MCVGKPHVDNTYQNYALAEAERARQQEDARQVRIGEGMSGIKTAFDGTAAVLDQREAAQRAYLLPQLDKRRDDAAAELTYALSRAGLLNSSAAGQKQANLGEAYGLQKADILSQISGDISGQRTLLNQNRSSLEAGLRSSGDATAATDAALATASNFRDTLPKVSPLGDIFYGLSQGIGAVQNGYQVGQIRRMATPNPLGGGSGRLVA